MSKKSFKMLIAVSIFQKVLFILLLAAFIAPSHSYHRSYCGMRYNNTIYQQAPYSAPIIESPAADEKEYYGQNYFDDGYLTQDYGDQEYEEYFNTFNFNLNDSGALTGPLEEIKLYPSGDEITFRVRP